MASGSIETVFQALQVAGARYLVVGGVAVVLHGHLRFTADLDLVLALDSENVRRALSALSGLGFVPRAPVAAEGLADPDTRADWIESQGLAVFSLHSPEHPATEVDVFVEEPFPFDAAHARATWVELGDTRVAVASIPDLIEMKRRAGRAQDADDIRALELLQSGGGDGA